MVLKPLYSWKENIFRTWCVPIEAGCIELGSIVASVSFVVLFCSRRICHLSGSTSMICGIDHGGSVVL